MATPTASAIAVAAAVRQRRLDLGITQAELASRTGVPVTTYARFERTGSTTLERLLRVADALGLAITVAGSSLGIAGLPTDPRLHRIRRRGLRHPRPVDAAPATPAPTSVTPAAAPSDKAPVEPSAPRRVAKPSLPARPQVSAAAAAAMASLYRDAIRNVVRVIVDNRLTNYTAAAVVQNTMRAQRTLTEADRPAFVAALEGELERLDAANLAEFSLDRAHYELWSKTWDPRLGIVHVLD